MLEDDREVQQNANTNARQPLRKFRRSRPPILNEFSRRVTSRNLDFNPPVNYGNDHPFEKYKNDNNAKWHDDFSIDSIIHKSKTLMRKLTDANNSDVIEQLRNGDNDHGLDHRKLWLGEELFGKNNNDQNSGEFQPIRISYITTQLEQIILSSSSLKDDQTRARTLIDEILPRTSAIWKVRGKEFYFFITLSSR